MLTKGRINNVLTVTYNRNSSTSTNLYAYNTNVVGAAGIEGVSSDPFDWGIPGLSFTTIADLRDRTPSRRVDQRIQISNSTMRSWGRHAVRWGGEFRYLRLDSLSNSNPRGSFVFTGLYTSALANGRAVPGTGLDLADFLLGYAQQASVQYGPGDLKHAGPRLEPLPPGRLAHARQRHDQLRVALRVRLAVLRSEQPSRQPRRELRLHRGRARRGRRDGSVHRSCADEPRRGGSQQRGAAGRRGVAGAPGHDGPRRVRHQLQPRGLRDHRTEARRAAAVRGHVHEPRNRGRAAAARRSVRAGRQRNHDEFLRHRPELRPRRRADLERRSSRKICRTT